MFVLFRFQTINRVLNYQTDLLSVIILRLHYTPGKNGERKFQFDILAHTN